MTFPKQPLPIRTALRGFTLLLLTLSAPVRATGQPVIIDAADGNTEVEVQAALDAHPPGTTFLMRGTFYFSGHVHIEKSGTRILGAWEDTNHDGKPDEGDAWHTTIHALPNSINLAEAFSLMPRDEVSSGGYQVKELEISGIHLAGFNRPVVVFAGPSYDQDGCRDTPLPYELDKVLLANNWVEGGAFWIYRRTDRVTIHNNHFTLFANQELEAHAIEMRGLSVAGCDMEFELDLVFQDRLTITDNVFTGARDISVGFQRDLRIEGNVFSGNQPGDLATNRLWISQASKALVKNNRFHGEDLNGAVWFWTRSNWSGVPGITSDEFHFIDNHFIDSPYGITILGGTDNTAIKGNRFEQSGDFGPFSITPIRVSDIVIIGGELMTRPSHKLEITNNHIADAIITGVLLNGQTSGVTIENNQFDNPLAEFGDVALADEDVLFGYGDALCPAFGNQVLASKSQPAVVINGYSERCEAGQPNTLKGNGIIDITP